MGEDADFSLPLNDEVRRTLVENHQVFLAFLQRRVGRREVAEDILQEAFARSIQRTDGIRDAEAIVPWFYRVLKNAAIDHFRRMKTRDRAFSAFAEELARTDVPDQELIDEVCGCVGRLVETLKPEYADALRGLELQGLSITEFAEARGITKSNAAVRAFRAREALRRQLERSCGTCAEHGCFDCTCDVKAGCH
ncbi:MAG: sigma-70 family RNA polymerase sigma factor [Polyangiaceae bacterium]